MRLPSVKEFKLAGSTGDECHPYVNSSGAFAGDGTPLLERDFHGDWKPRDQEDLENQLGKSINFQTRMKGLGHVAQALNDGNIALANVSLVLLKLPAVPIRRTFSESPEFARFERFDPAELRILTGNPGAGEWTSGGSATSYRDLIASQIAPNADEVAYNGIYHDQVVDWFANILRRQGLLVETNLPLTSAGGEYTALADIVFMNPHTDGLFLLEIKTGDDPTFTANQAAVYPMAAIGLHIYSFSDRIKTFGFGLGERLPPMEVYAVYAAPGKELKVIPLTPNFVKFLQEYTKLAIAI